MRSFKTFFHKNARYEICCKQDKYQLVIEEIIKQRQIIENYIRIHKEFQHSFVPIELKTKTESIIQRMQKASELTGIGPMAGVAGAIAQAAAEKIMSHDTNEIIINNGGDIYLVSPKPVIIGLYAGKKADLNKLALEVMPDQMPLAICSSSGKMGHSTSLGDCDLATVIAKDAALADAAATLAANLVRKAEDINKVLEKTNKIPGISGIIIIKENNIGLIGNLPRLIKHENPDLSKKI